LFLLLGGVGGLEDEGGLDEEEEGGGVEELLGGLSDVLLLVWTVHVGGTVRLTG
jgi:hypothetical protein